MSLLRRLLHLGIRLRGALLQTWPRLAATFLRKTAGRSDVARWGRPEELLTYWDERTEILAALVPEGSSVLEFGAGRRVLERHLPPGCRYTPSDLVDRGGGTIICDLNSPVLPEFPKHDIAVLGGVLEYVHDVPRLVQRLAGTCDAVIASYAVTDIGNQGNVLRRRSDGWVNDYSSDELAEVFLKGGFECIHRGLWRSQRILKFRKRA